MSVRGLPDSDFLADLLEDLQRGRDGRRRPSVPLIELRDAVMRSRQFGRKNFDRRFLVAIAELALSGRLRVHAGRSLSLYPNNEGAFDEQRS